MRKGDVIDGTWVVDGPLGRGGMGSVYRCHHKQSSRILAAVKVLAGSLRDDSDAVVRFVREAEILHKLDHASVVKVRNIRVDADPPYLEMEFIQGPHLGELIVEGGLPVDQAMDYARQVLAALAYLHGNDVRHRDIKPENVLIRGGTDQVVLVDFGLALDAGVTRLTVGNMAFGTVAYAPPEWLKPSEIDPCSWDLYATGVLLWEMLTGEEPFPASGEGAPRQQALQVMLGKQGAPGLDPGEAFAPRLREVVRCLTAPDKADRPTTASQALGMLDAAIAQQGEGWDPDAALAWSAQPETQDAAALPTAVPPPHRHSASHAVIEERRSRLPAWVLVPGIAAVAALAAFGARVLVEGATDEPLADLPVDGDVVPVRLVLPDLPNPDHLAIAMDGRLPSRVTERAAWFDEIMPGARTIQWAYGVGCPLNTCPGDDCDSWCGSGLVVVEVPEDGPSPTVVNLAIDLPRREVSVLVKALKDPPKGLFKKTPPTPWGWLAGVEGEVDGAMLRFTDIPPGEHALLVNMGSCPPEARGCSRDESCPPGCASEQRPVRVSWEEGPLVLTSDLDPPQ